MPHKIDNNRFRKLLLIYPEKAIELLYKNYYSFLKTLAMQLTQHEEVAEDIVQETFVHVWEDYKKLGNHDLHIKYYLVRVVRYKSINHYRQQARQEEKKLQYINEEIMQLTTEPIENDIINRELIDKARSHIEAFPRREKECLLMRIFGGMTTEQIAHDLNVTIKAVERSLTCGGKRLRRVMATSVMYA